jgi:hypothetical protein
LTLGTGSLAGKLAKFGRSLTLAKAGRASRVTAFSDSLRATFNGRGVLGQMRNVYRGFNPSTWTRAVGEGRDAYRAARAFPLLDAPLSSSLRFPFNRELAGQLDDMARIADRYGPDVISRLHSGALGVSKVNAGVETVASTVDNVPIVGGLDRTFDRLTTREVGSRW